MEAIKKPVFSLVNTSLRGEYGAPILPIRNNIQSFLGIKPDDSCVKVDHLDKQVGMTILELKIQERKKPAIAGF